MVANSEEFELTEAANRKLPEFSGGMHRRLDLVTSLSFAHLSGRANNRI
ncbi:MAG: hypothetical protein LBH38_03925 [Holosporales bacterium]|jgi:ABC-type multidrug transport system ATPase subunit|nr:hypothetical protein [Holosporales bacterium]